MTKEKIQEVIVVEGKDDTAAIKRAVSADTIETRGSAIDDDTLALIERLATTRGIIVFTDPDYPGERIRKIVSEVVPEAKHAFLPREEGLPGKAGGSLGVEHASPAAIRQALAAVYTAAPITDRDITQADLIAAGLIGGPTAKARRIALGQQLKIGYVNGKQLGKRLAMFQISRGTFMAAVAQLDDHPKEAPHDK